MIGSFAEMGEIYFKDWYRVPHSEFLEFEARKAEEGIKMETFLDEVMGEGNWHVRIAIDSLPCDIITLFLRREEDMMTWRMYV